MIAGQKVGKLLLIEQVRAKSEFRKVWRCICDCGKECFARDKRLEAGVHNSCGCGRVKDLSGQRFGKLLVIRRTGTAKGYNAIWLCKCDCGKTREAIGSSLLSGSCNSCCYKNGYKGYNDLSGSYFNSIKKGARERELEFALSIEFLWNLYEKQDKKCVFSGLDIVFSKNWTEKAATQTASLDRINSDIGYLENNVQWVHKDINFMKFRFSNEHFIKMCNLITWNTSKKNKSFIKFAAKDMLLMLAELGLD